MTDIHRKLALFGFVLILLVAAGCGLFTKPDYFPMTLNDVWNYDVTVVVTQWGAFDTTFTMTVSAEANVVLDTTILGAPAFKVAQRFDTLTSFPYVARTDTAVLTWGADSSGRRPATMLRLPLAENSAWTVDTNPRVGIRVSTVKTQESVTVPAGTFDKTWMVETVSDTHPDLPQRRWYAKDVGTVKIDRTNRQVMGPETTETTTTHELRSYTVH